MLVAQSCLTPCDSMDCSPPGSCPWNSPGKNSRVGCHSLLQGIFPTQGWEPWSPEFRADTLSAPTNYISHAAQLTGLQLGSAKESRRRVGEDSGVFLPPSSLPASGSVLAVTAPLPWLQLPPPRPTVVPAPTQRPQLRGSRRPASRSPRGEGSSLQLLNSGLPPFSPSPPPHFSFIVSNT